MSNRSATPPLLSRWRHVALWAMVLAILAAVFTLYVQPEMMRTLAEQVWACF